jgi:PAS domain S-box-containing protein
VTASVAREDRADGGSAFSAGQPGARAAFLAGLGLLVAITVVDVLIGDSPVLIGLLAIPPILTVPLGERRSTVLIAGLCFLIAVASPAWDTSPTTTYITRLLIVGLTGVAAIWAVTVRLRAQRDLRALAAENARLAASSERARGQLDALIDNAPVGVAFLDPELRVRRVNRTFVAINGGAVEDHVGRPLYEAIPTVSDRSRDAIDAAMRTGVPQLDVEVTKPGAVPGEPERHYLVNYYRIDGAEGVAGLGILAQDISEGTRFRQEVERQRNLYETLLRTQSEAGEGMALLDGDAVEYVNDAATEIVGYSIDEFRALPTYLEVFPEDERDRIALWLAGVVMQEPDAAATIETRLVHKAGHPIDVELSAQPVTGRREAVPGQTPVVIVGRDITDRKAVERERGELLVAEQTARRRLEASHRRMSVLARAGAILERSLDLDDTLPLVAELVVGEVADACTIDVRTAGRRPWRVSRSGAATETGDDSRLLVLPLLAGDAVVGSLTVGRRTLDDQDDQLVRELARRVALAVANARLYEERDEVAATLQESLLPPALPEIEGYALAAAFRPAGAGNEVGGDFYDAFGIAQDKWGLVIGDVCGKGASAAAITALVRYSIRTITAHASDPGAVLTELNDILLRHGDRERFCTAIFARLDTSADGLVRIASGGHLPPVLVRSGAAAELADVRGTLLGVVGEPRLPDHHVALGAGDTLVLFTDGVVEAVAADGEPIGVAGILRAAEALAGDSPQELADHLADLALDTPGRQRDDIAVLVLRRS